MDSPRSASRARQAPLSGRVPAREARPRKALGQHFLVDQSVARRALQAAEVSGDDVVVEVGPGTGALTRALAERAGRVVAMELDEALATRLRAEFRLFPHVEIVRADARTVDVASLLPGRAGYKVVANLPYYAASPIIRRFLESERKPSVMVVMVQKEVAEEMAAPPGKMGLLSVAVQLYAVPRVLFTVPPAAFDPPPKVWSAVVRLDARPAPAVAGDDVAGFFQMVKAGFSAPRKQLRNALALGLDIPPPEAGALIARAGLDPARRAETLTLEEWERLHRAKGG